jgi:hypothetical protein
MAFVPKVSHGPRSPACAIELAKKKIESKTYYFNPVPV